MIRLETPITEEQIRQLHTGDVVSLNGIVVTARDAAHKLMIENFIRTDAIKRQDLHEVLKPLLEGGVIYHCGPVVGQNEDGSYRFVAAGPTTSIREEPYQAEVIGHFKARGVIGKGGMGAKTLAGCREHGAVYFHAVGGAASLIASNVEEVVDVYLMDELGVPEAFWVIRVKDWQLVVTMDSHGNSLHEEIEQKSAARFKELVGLS
ncbi:FumA C-terminus/TtdB family hydratase beta subunit [Chloroflexota bacterium]